MCAMHPMFGKFATLNAFTITVSIVTQDILHSVLAQMPTSEHVGCYLRKVDTRVRSL